MKSIKESYLHNCFKKYWNNVHDFKHTAFAMDFETSELDGGEYTSEIAIVTYGLIAIKKHNVKNPKIYSQNATHNGWVTKDAFKLALDECISIVRKSKCYSKHIELWFNNSAKFDNIFILDWLRNYDYEQVETKKIQDKQYWRLAGDGIGDLTILFSYKGYKFEIKDFYKFANLSIDKIGKIVGYDKLTDIGEKYYDRNFKTLSENEKNEYIEYAKRDTEILIKGIQLFNAELKIGTTKAYTLPSLALATWKEMCIDYSFLKITYNNYLLGRESYFGGYTNASETHKGKALINKDIKCFDINSAYPAAMMQPLPIREIDENDVKTGFYKFTKLYRILIKKAKLKPGFSTGIIRDRTKQNTFFKNINPNKPLRYTVWEIELDKFNEHYDLEYDIVETHYFELKENVFTSYINKFYEKKSTSKKMIKEYMEKGDDEKVSYYQMENQVAKLMMNSLYGKTGQKPIFDSKYILPGEHEKGEILKLGTFNSKTFEYDFNYYRVVSKSLKVFDKDYSDYTLRKVNEFGDDLIPDNANNIFLASYITSLVRCSIYDVMKEMGDNFIYSDTDSAWCIGSLPEHMIDEYELGKWKLENEWKHFKTLGAKKYVGIATDDPIIGNPKDKSTKIVVAGASIYKNAFGKHIDEFAYGMILGKKSKVKLKKGCKILEIEHIIKQKIEKNKNNYDDEFDELGENYEN